MLCNKCNKNEASYFMEQNINGKVTKLALCPECAKKYGHVSFKPFGSFNLLDDLFGFVGIDRIGPVEAKKCTLCASTFDDIVNNGKVGCAKCYEVFEEELRPTIRRLHGNVRHVGRSPKQVCGCSEAKSCETNENVKEEKKVSEIDSLRAELSRAVAAEEFEKAAELRDRIKGIENENRE